MVSYDEMMGSLAELRKALREETEVEHKSLRQMASEIGVTHSCLFWFLRGSNPQATNLVTMQAWYHRKERASKGPTGTGSHTWGPGSQFKRIERDVIEAARRSRGSLGELLDGLKCGLASQSHAARLAALGTMGSLIGTEPLGGVMIRTLSRWCEDWYESGAQVLRHGVEPKDSWETTNEAMLCVTLLAWTAPFLLLSYQQGTAANVELVRAVNKLIDESSHIDGFASSSSEGYLHLAMNADCSNRPALDELDTRLPRCYYSFGSSWVTRLQILQACGVLQARGMLTPNLRGLVQSAAQDEDIPPVTQLAKWELAGGDPSVNALPLRSHAKVTLSAPSTQHLTCDYSANWLQNAGEYSHVFGYIRRLWDAPEIDLRSHVHRHINLYETLLHVHSPGEWKEALIRSFHEDNCAVGGVYDPRPIHPNFSRRIAHSYGEDESDLAFRDRVHMANLWKNKAQKDRSQYLEYRADLRPDLTKRLG